MAFAHWDLIGSLNDVMGRLSTVAKSVGVETPRLVAVSKTKSAEAVRIVHDAGQRHFGENYVQELFEKSTSPELLTLDDIRWHFIGHLQTNKCNKLVKIPHLWMVETVDSTKLASALNSSWSKADKDRRLKVMIQVNTSEEESKAGCPSEAVIELAVHIWNLCPKLELCGLMAIGRLGHDYKLGLNPDFVLLNQLRAKVSSVIGVQDKCLGLSIGMSDDFEQAVKAGSTNVRIGSAIFGTRRN